MFIFYKILKVFQVTFHVIFNLLLNLITHVLWQNGLSVSKFLYVYKFYKTQYLFLKFDYWYKILGHFYFIQISLDYSFFYSGIHLLLSFFFHLFIIYMILDSCLSYDYLFPFIIYHFIT